MATLAAKSLLLVFFFVFFMQHSADAQRLRMDYYKNNCPSLETIVSSTTAKIISKQPSLAPSLLRLHFHDCFVRGCDGSVLINSTRTNTAEKDSIPNQSLRGYNVIDSVKSAVEKKCPGQVSCADILALVARDAVSQIRGPFWKVPLGRRDGRVSNSNEALRDLPPPFFNATQLKASFSSKGLNAKDLAVLSGGHTIGFSHCSSFTTRIYNFTGQGDSDPALDAKFVRDLKRVCKPTDTTSVVPMDRTSGVFDTDYFTAVKNKRGLFQSDTALLSDRETNKYITLRQSTSSNGAFFRDFAASMEKMGKIGVMTGNAGEIRKVCSRIN